MSSDNSNKFIKPGLKLLVKYVGHKHLLVGSLTESELDFLKNMIAFDETMYYSILHSFNRKKQPILDNGKIIPNSFLKGYYKYFDIGHRMWGEKGLCPKYETSVDCISGHEPGYARISHTYENELQTKTYSYQYRRLCRLHVPWANEYYGKGLNSIMDECVFRPCIVTHKSDTNETVIKGLYIRIDKEKAIKFLKGKGLYNVSSTDAQWGHNLDLKKSFRNISCNNFKNKTVGKDMKTILTPIRLENEDMIPSISIPKLIYKHTDGTVPLKRYQLANVEWMSQLENGLEHYAIDIPLTVEIIPRVYFDHFNDRVYDHSLSTKSVTPKGGGLFDEVGLGKTLTCITLIALNKPSDEIGCKKLKNRVIKDEEPLCTALITSGKRVKENGGPVSCGRVIKQAKATKATPNPISIDLLLKNKMCSMHGKNLTGKEPKTNISNVEKETEPTEKIDSTGKGVTRQDNKWKSRATLVICPNQIPYQWVSQIKEYTNPCLTVHAVTNVHEFRKLSYRDVINADVIVTTIDCIERGTVTSNDSSKSKSPDSITLEDNCPDFNMIWWHRVIIDEMHRITNKKYRYAPTRIFRIPSTYRWAITGTPFQKDQLNYDVIASWLYGDSEYYTNSRKRLFSKIQDQSDVLVSVFRRNTKKSTEHLIPINSGNTLDAQNKKLWQTVTQTEVWLDLSKIERAMYNARKASKPYWTKDKDDEYLRQICCHPNLSAENSKIVYAVNNSVTGGNRYATNANDVKQALLDHNQKLIQSMIDTDIPNRIKASWTAQDAYLIDITDKKPRMAYYSTVHQIKRTFFKLYQLRKSARAYSDINNQDKKPIVLCVCSGCMKNIDVSGSIDIYVGECGHTFCKKCGETKAPVVDLTNYAQTDLISLIKSDIATHDDEEEEKEPKKKKSKKLDKPTKKKSYEKKIVDGHAMCNVCKEDCNTIGMINAIEIDPTELLMDMHSGNGVTSSDEEVSDQEDDAQTNCEYIPKDFKEEMGCAVSLYGTKITHLIAYLKTFTSKPHNNRIIIFSQWDNLLQGIMETLSNFDLPAMMCKGNVFQKKKAIHNFKTNSYYKIILLSSKYAASGLDLIEANKVIFIDPVYGDFDTVKQIEDQAIGRAHRLGQKNPIEVVRFLVKDTIEEECFKDWQTVVCSNK